MKVEDIEVANGWMLVKPFNPLGMTEGGIELPLQKHEKPNKGKVICVDDDDCELHGFYKGDTVIFSKFAGNTIKIDDIDYIWLRCQDIFGFVPSS